MSNQIIQTKIITDSELMETLQHGTKDYPFHFYDEHMAQFDFHCIEWHWHTEFEFVYIQSDYVDINIGNEQLTVKEGQGLFINSKILHRFTAQADASIPNFLCHPTFIASADSLIYNQYIAPVLSSCLQYQVFTKETPWQAEILTLMQEIIAIQTKDANELLSSSLAQKLWHILYTNLKASLKPRKEVQSASTQGRLQMIMSYIHDHYMEEITLEDMANHFLFSRTTIMNLFKDNLQISPINYLIQYRLKQASHLLLSSEKKLTSIAMETGFHNVEYFCRMFKKQYHMTPTEYRKRK